MKAYLDTSSLLKLYHSEPGSQGLYEIIATDVDAIHLSEIAKLEFKSAIWKKIRLKQITSEIGISVIGCFEMDYGRFHWINLDSSIIKGASELLMKYGTDGLRTLDSIQFACAMTLKNDDCWFFTSDKLLLKLFEKEQLNTRTYDQ